MNQTDPTADFDGCRRTCRQQGAHTLIWGACEHASEPEPTVSLSRVYTDTDGRKSIGFDSYTVPQLAELITAGLRASDLPVNADDFVDIASIAAYTIVHRNDEAAASAVVAPPTDRAAVARVRALHQPMERGPFTICAHCSGWDGKWRCLGVVTDYPCPTVRALDGEQAVEAHGTGTQQQDAGAWRCDAGFVFGGRCVKPAGHQDTHVTAPVAQQPAAEAWDVPDAQPGTTDYTLQQRQAASDEGA